MTDTLPTAQCDHVVGFLEAHRGSDAYPSGDVVRHSEWYGDNYRSEATAPLGFEPFTFCPKCGERLIGSGPRPYVAAFPPKQAHGPDGQVVYYWGEIRLPDGWRFDE